MIALQYIRSFIFIVVMYVGMAVIAIGLFPLALIGGRAVATAICRLFCYWVRFSAHWIAGLRTEARGVIPRGDVLIASKHQSFLDILLIYSVLPRAKFIMKHELVWTPFVGWYAWLTGCIPVNRGKRGAAIKAMLVAVRNPRFAGGQLIIFPQGTRVAPGVKAEYKIGAAALYHAMKQPCVPVATNVGVFWGRHSLMRKPGVAVIEFLPEIAPGMDLHAFMARIETEIETASDRLMDESSFRL
ncbi:MAG TPA: lysophospholipid acyltransferase family protein [Paenirhodobacter sp.]